MTVLTYQVLTAEMPVQTRRQTATNNSAPNAVTVTPAPKPNCAKNLRKKTEKKTANATTQTQECSNEDRQQEQINTQKNTNDCKCWDIFIKSMYSQFHKLNNCKSLVEEIEEFVALSEFFQDSYPQAHWCPAVREIFERMRVKSLEFLSRIENHEFDETFDNFIWLSVSFYDFRKMTSENLNCCCLPASWETYNK